MTEAVEWRAQPRWCVLETGFGPATHFLATWRAWRDDPQRPALLHYVAVAAVPCSADAIRHHAANRPLLKELADALADGWWGLEPGTQRISLEGGRVLLTLLVGESVLLLRGLGRFADSVRIGPGMPTADLARAVARCCRRGARLVAGEALPALREALTAAGFEVSSTEPDQCARLVHLPARHQDPVPRVAGDAVVVGAGLAGAAVARALALRGWTVTVREAGPGPAAGASGVPAGLFAPHVSADDAVLSRISRAGVRALRGAAESLLQRGVDWELSGVVQFQEGEAPLWHPYAGWLRPARLVQALLATPGITVRYGDRVQTAGPGVLTVIATGFEAGDLLGEGLALQPVAGQVSFGAAEGAPATPHPWNGHGHFLPSIPDEAGARVWLAGASFERDMSALTVAPQALTRHRADNQQRLRELLPSLAPTLGARFDHAQDWRGVRGTSPDRLPIVGPWPPGGDDSVWACTALGARGITTAVLCADLLVARLHHEPLPIAPRLAEALCTERILRRLQKPSKQAADSS